MTEPRYQVASPQASGDSGGRASARVGVLAIGSVVVVGGLAVVGLSLGARQAAARARAAPTNPIPVPPPPAEQRAPWAPLATRPGLKVRDPGRSFTTDAAAAVIDRLAAAAAAAGATITLQDASGPIEGDPFPPHKSHRFGRDFDISYTLDGRYPTPPLDPVDARLPGLLDAIAPWIERVGVNAWRAAPFEGHAYLISRWPGHVGHLHLRLRRELTREPRAEVQY